MTAPALLLACCLGLTFQDEEFSGPQTGEPLPDCQIKVIMGPQAGQTIQLHTQTKDQPCVVLFVHEVTRPSVGLVRTISNYANRRSKDGLVTTVVFLTANPTDTENWMNRAKGALPQKINVGLSPDGIEGPGAFGLNRKMQVTGLVAENKKVKSNFAIIQPSIQVDAKKVCSAIAKVLGDNEMPTLKDLGLGARGQKMTRGKRKAKDNPATQRPSDGRYEKMMRPFIQKTATDEQTNERALQIEKAAAQDPALRKRIYDVTNRIIDAGKLENYGTARAQEFLKKWSQEFGKPKSSKD